MLCHILILFCGLMKGAASTARDLSAVTNVGISLKSLQLYSLMATGSVFERQCRCCLAMPSYRLAGILLLGVLITLSMCAGREADAFVPFVSTARHQCHAQNVVAGTNRATFSDRYLAPCTRPKSGFRPLAMASSTSKANVVYQKIVRPPPDVPSALVLGNLVEYLQDHFQLPNNLPMVYESQPSETNAVLSWDSPLSSCPSETRMNVEVMGIYTDKDDNAAPSVPNMAMVVVSKDPKPSLSSLAPMMQNLFADSEKRILRALDRGLDDLHQGKIQFSNKASKPENVQSVDEAIDAELMEENPPVSRSSRGVHASNVVVDTTATSDARPKPSSKAETKPSATSSEDYAVTAAKQAAARSSMQAPAKPAESKSQTVSSGDYAVEAAKRAAATRAVNGDKKATSSAQAVTSTSAEARSDVKTPRRFTISTPKQRAERISAAANKKTSKKEKAISNSNQGSLADGPSLDKNRKRTKKEVPDVKSVNKESSTDDTTKAKREVKVNTGRSVNLRVHETDDSEIAEAELKEPFETMVEQGTKTQPANGKRTVTQADMERDVMEAAQKVMSEMASQGVDMSPEELLQDVLKFGEQNDQENAVGSGFVSGAFEKAKDLLREQKQRREERLNQEMGYKDMFQSMSGVRPDILDPDDKGESERELTAEEELKRIFEAGERLADGRIQTSRSGSTTSAMNDAERKEQDEVDALISGEKSVSNYARSLDDELAELEVRINTSPGEELDGPTKNPRFDIFSGPEVYNPNVDPETAVNWPGAQPGSKNLRLPKELDEAVKQARFAADVLAKMNEVESTDGQQYYVGKRELNQQQVDNLRTVVDEAVQIGLIDDPLEYLAERSRLQMALDELTAQPEERFRDILSNFKDLLLSDNFVPLIKERLEAMADRDVDARRRGDESLNERHARERQILGHLVEYAQLLLKEARALGAELEASQLEIVRSICQVAMDPSHRTEEETANALSDAVRDMRPLLDDVFVAYLKYATAEEEGRLARAGLLDDPEHNEWLFVLKIVQQGVYAEISRGINRYIEHIWMILRMETKVERRMLLSKIIDDLPTMDVRPFVQVVNNIVASLGDSARGEFDGYELGEMSNKILQLHRDVKELLPPERIKLMSRDADEWAAKQKQRLLEQRKVTQQRLKAARDSTDYDDEIRRRGEMERIE